MSFGKSNMLNSLEGLSQNFSDYNDLDGLSISSFGEVNNSASIPSPNFGNWNNNLRVIDDDEVAEENYIKNSPIHEIEESTESTEPTINSKSLLEDFNSVSAALPLTFINNAYTTELNNSLDYNARIGNSPSGHAPDAMLQAQHQENINSTLEAVRSAEIIGGSLFGPEGLLVGTAAAALTQNYSSGQPIPDMQGNSGDIISASEIAT